MAENDDIKERMKAALEAKNKKSAKGGPGGASQESGKAHGNTDRAGGKREFRRKSGG